MKIQKEFTDDHQVKITAEFDNDLLDQFKHKAARKISRTTRIPGFRPGKAPYAMVLSHVGEGAITEEGIELMLEKVYPELLDEAKITPYAPGNLDAIKSENPPIFEFTIPLEPELELGALEELKEAYQPETVSDQAVADFILKTRRNAATIVPVETPAAEGNVVYITLEGEDTQAAEGADPILIKANPQQVMIPTAEEQQEIEWPYKGFSRSLLGHSAGEELSFPYTFPEDYSDKSLAGKTINFKVNVQSVKALELPEMSEDFLEKLGGFKTLEGLEDTVRKQLQFEADSAYDDAYYAGLVDKIRAMSTIKYPPQMLAEEEEQVIHRFEHELSHRQLDLELFLRLRKSDRETFIREEVSPTAINRLERSLVMEALSKKFDIQIKNEELEHEINFIVNDLIQSGELGTVQKDLGEKQFANAISMEAAQRALEKAIRYQLRKTVSPESIVELEPVAETEPVGDSETEVVDESEPEAAAESVTEEAGESEATAPTEESDSAA